MEPGFYLAKNAPNVKKKKKIKMNDDLREIEISGNQGGYSYKDIVMAQYKKITTFFNIEFRGGFYTKLPVKDGGERLVYIEDTRETLANAILGLAIILKPKFNKDTYAYYRLTLARLNKIKKEFTEASTLKEKTVLGENFYQEEKDKILLHEYKNQKLQIFIKLFDKLSQQLAKLKYFEVIGGTF